MGTMKVWGAGATGKPQESAPIVIVSQIKDPRLPDQVYLTTKNTPSLTLGIVSIVFGSIALLVVWIPLLGIVALPLAGVGIILAILGFIIAACKHFSGWGMPVLGGGLNVLATVICFFWVFATMAAIRGVERTMERAQPETQAQIEARTKMFAASSELERERVRIETEKDAESKRNADALAAAIAEKERAEQPEIVDMTWGKDEYGSAISQFTIVNNRPYAIKDIVLRAYSYGSSGTHIDSYESTLYEIIPAGGRKPASINLHVNRQAASLSVSIRKYDKADK